MCYFFLDTVYLCILPNFLTTTTNIKRTFYGQAAAATVEEGWVKGASTR